MRGGGSEYHRVALLGKELSEVATQAILVGHLVTLINNDNIPMGLLKPCTKTTVVLQGVDRDDGLVVVVEGILVEGNLILYLGYTHTVETHKGNGKAVPYLLLKLCKNALKRTYEYAFATASAYHLSQEDTHLNGFSQAHAISDEQAGTRQFQSFQCGGHLIISHVESSMLCYGNLAGII